MTADNLNKLKAQEERNREQLIMLKGVQEVTTLKLEVEKLGRKISEGELGIKAAQQVIMQMKAEIEGFTQGSIISTNKRCVLVAQKEIVKLKRELTEARKSLK